MARLHPDAKNTLTGGDHVARQFDPDWFGERDLIVAMDADNLRALRRMAPSESLDKVVMLRSFDPDMVTRLLDLVSSHFDYVVFDMPRTWFSWTDSVLLGSNKVFIVSEATVPGLRQAKPKAVAKPAPTSKAPISPGPAV